MTTTDHDDHDHNDHNNDQDVVTGTPVEASPSGMASLDSETGMDWKGLGKD